MAVTHALVRATPYSLAYLFTHDGLAGDVETILNAELVGDCVAGPLLELLQETVTTQGEARTLMFGDGADENIPHAFVEITPRSAAALAATTGSVDADADEDFDIVDLTFAASSGVAAEFYVEIRFEHTYSR